EQQQKSTLSPRDRKRSIEHRIQNIVGRERALQGARDFEHGAKFFKIRRAGAPALPAGIVLRQQLLNFIPAFGEVNLVAVRNPKFDAFGTFEPAGFLEPLTVDPNAVPAAEVLENVSAIVAGDLRMISRDTAVAQNQIVIGRPPHLERKRE